MLKNMQHLEEVSDMTLVTEDNERIRAHKVVLASVRTPSGNDNKNTYYEIIHIKVFFSKFKIHDIWCTMQNLRRIKEIMKVSWKSKEV